MEVDLRLRHVRLAVRTKIYSPNVIFWPANTNSSLNLIALNVISYFATSVLSVTAMSPTFHTVAIFLYSLTSLSLFHYRTAMLLFSFGC